MKKIITMILFASILLWSSFVVAADVVYITAASGDSFVFKPTLENYIVIAPVKVKTVDRKAAFRKLSSSQLLALAIYGESRSESLEGKLAVGTAIMERHSHFNQSVKRIILEPSQFSCFNTKDKQFSRLENIALNWRASYKKSPLLRECYTLARGLINGTIVGHRLIMENCVTYFKTPVAHPKWAKKYRYVVQIGNHQFYSTTPARVEYVAFQAIFMNKKKSEVM